MATVTRKIEVQECDWHPGVDAVETVPMTVGGQKRLVDVCEACRDELAGLGRAVKAPRRRRKAAARKAVRRTTRARTNGNGRSTHRKVQMRQVQLTEIRQWANDHGYDVSTHGKVPREIEAAYKAAKR